VTAGPLARTVADAALLLDALAGPGDAHWATVPPTWDGGPFLGAAVRGEGRYALGVSRDPPWSAEYGVVVAPDAEEPRQAALRELDALGHGTQDLAFAPAPGYGPAFRTVWQAGAAALPLDDAELALVEPLTRWLVETGRRRSARDLAEALAFLAGFERRFL